MTEQKREVRREKTILPRPTPLEEQGFTTGQEVVASNLSPQLGSDAKDLAKGGVDMRRLSVLSEPLQAALAYFSWRGGGQEYTITKQNGNGNGEEEKVKKVRKGVRFWSHISDFYINTSPSLEGRGRRQLIEMQRATTPGVPQPRSEEERPGWIGRNITQRDWKEKQEKY